MGTMKISGVDYCDHCKEETNTLAITGCGSLTYVCEACYLRKVVDFPTTGTSDNNSREVKKETKPDVIYIAQVDTGEGWRTLNTSDAHITPVWRKLIQNMPTTILEHLMATAAGYGPILRVVKVVDGKIV